jgi:hypothetical protein
VSLKGESDEGLADIGYVVDNVLYDFTSGVFTFDELPLSLSPVC